MIGLTRKEAAEIAKQLFNHICVLHDTTLVRVIGFHEDALDYYYHVRYMNSNVPAVLKERGSLESYSTFVGSCVSLKNSYERYDHMDHVFALNGCPPADEFSMTVASYEDNELMYGKDVADWFRDGCPETD